MKLLVTGGAGFIGSNFILYWLKNHPSDFIVNLDVLTYAACLDSLKEVEKNPNYKFVKGDICDGKVASKATDGVDVIVHFAAESHVDRSILGPAIFIKTNVIGTQVLLENALKHKVKRFHHISCYDTKTRAFTPQGLKSYDKIKRGDLVLTLNTETCKVEWKPVEEVIVQPYKGKMIRMKTTRVDFLVTPNHRMLFQTKRAERMIYKIAEDAKKEAINKLPKYYEWQGQIPKIIEAQKSPKDFMYVLGVFLGDGFVAYQEKKLTNKTGLSKEEYIERARNSLGQFSLIGKIGNQDFSISRAWRVFLDIPEKDPCRRRCEKSLERLGIRWHSHKGKAGEHLYFASKDFVEFFRQCGKNAKNKRIPRWALDAPSELLLPLFEGLMDSDGTKRRVFFTSSYELACQFMELCVKLGLSPSLKPRYTVSRIGNRKISGDSYVISVGKEWRSIRREIIKEEEYNGKVWCLKVKDNKNFLIERDGKTAFCGNTDEVFGSLKLNDSSKFNERTPYDPRSPYAATKAASDHLVRAYHFTFGLPITISNCSNNFGPYQFPEKFIPLTITNILEGKKAPIYGDGLYVRDWLYVEDHCRAIDLILQKGKLGETYCVGGQTGDINNLQVAKKILKILNKGKQWIEFVKDRPGHDRRYAIDWSKIKNELGWEPKYDFDVWLEKTVIWYKENQWWWKKLKKGKFEKYYKKQYNNG